MRKLLIALTLVLLLSYGTARADEPTLTPEPTSSGPQFTAGDIMERVNTLRASIGLPVLSIHPVLMQVAQTEANGLAAGAGGHWRPDGMTLGQWLLSLGYPLSGDLSMDGYRSENWFMAAPSTTSEEVTTWWQGDSAHDDAMFSPDRSDMGAALAQGADGQVYVVLETALQTASGKMQSDAYPFLTGIPQTQAAYSVMGTQAAANGLLPQFLSSVKLSTPAPDGNIYHVAQYGQSLWSIAIAYHTTIKDIQALNNLPGSSIREGQKLLVRKDAAQPTLLAKATPAEQVMPAPSFLAVYSPAPEQTAQPAPQEPSSNAGLSIAAIALAGLVLAGVFIGMRQTRPS